jgi:hypothetical protein
MRDDTDRHNEVLHLLPKNTLLSNEDSNRVELSPHQLESLCEAIKLDSSENIYSLLNNSDINLDVHINSQQTLLMFAIQYNTKIAMELVYAGANPNLSNSVNTSFPLFEAAKRDKTQLAIFLISYGANINKRNRNGLRAMDISTRQSLFKRTIEHLHESDIPLILLRDAIIHHDTDMLEAALALEPDFELFRYNNKDILSFSLTQDAPSYIVMRLIEQGVINSMTRKEKSQLMYYMKQGFGHVSTRNILRYGPVAKFLT